LKIIPIQEDEDEGDTPSQENIENIQEEEVDTPSQEEIEDNPSQEEPNEGNPSQEEPIDIQEEIEKVEHIPELVNNIVNNLSAKGELSDPQQQQQRKQSPVQIKPINKENRVNDIVSEHAANIQRDPADPSEKRNQEQEPEQGDQITIIASIDTQGDDVDPLNVQRQVDINNRVDEWIHSISNFAAEEPMQNDSKMIDNQPAMEKKDGAEMLKEGFEKLIKEAISEYIEENGP